MTDFRALLEALTSSGAEFIVVGRAAAAAHGSTRLTLDLDIVYQRGRENLARLAKALAPHSPYLRGSPPGLPFTWDVSGRPRDLEAIAALEFIAEEHSSYGLDVPRPIMCTELFSFSWQTYSSSSRPGRQRTVLRAVQGFK